MNPKNWTDYVDLKIRIVGESIYLDSEMQKILEEILNHENCPISSSYIEIDRQKPFVKVVFGNSEDTDPQVAKTLQSIDQNNTECHIKIWLKKAKKEINDQVIQQKIEDLVLAFWKPLLQEEKSRLVTFTNANEYELINRSIIRFLDKHKYLFVLYLDLDHFKQVNDQYDHNKGDSVILNFSSIIDRLSRDFGVPIHNSGDEFSIVNSSDNIEDIINFGLELNKIVSTYDFDIGNLKLSSTIGIKVTTREDEIDYKSLLKDAEKATKDVHGNKNRGLTRFYCKEEESTEKALKNYDIDLAICLIKSSLNISIPFKNVWLNFISQSANRLLGERVVFQDTMSDLIKACNFKYTEAGLQTSIPRDDAPSLSPVLSILDLSLAISHGIFRNIYLSESEYNAEDYKIIFDIKNNSFEIKNKKNILKYNGKGKKNKTLNLGKPFKKSNAYNFNTNKAILIKIGHFDLKLPEILFCDIITIDDRPTRGGGLPDFWEATIARLIYCVSNNRNIGKVFILGEMKFAKQTINKLKKVKSWKNDQDSLALRTGINPKKIIYVAETISDKISFPENEDELLRSLIKVMKNYCVFNESEFNDNLSFNVEKRFLNLEANLDTMRLKKEDGLRVDTIAEAYPIVLEIARKGTQTPIIDQAGQKLKELIDFKVCLLNPSINKIPYFYQNEKNLLIEYFKNQFTDNSGLFGSFFDKTGQLSAVVDHVVNSIQNNKQFATRRAILVIPHEIKEGEDLSPLGLISIRIIPRFELNGIKLIYSFTWRTVEALVGFPYSIYGSVCYSEYLTNLIKEKLPTAVSSKIQMGEVYYTANSLHFFMDKFGQNIARNIIFEASN